METNNIDIYDNLNKISDNEYENILLSPPIEKLLNINIKKNVNEYLEKTDDNNLIIKDKDNNDKQVFIKYITIVDSLKYLIGKYKNEDLNVMPFENTEEKEKTKYQEYINNKNNYAYVDSLFYYITSELNKNHDFIHGVKCYDMFMCQKKKCKINISDDLEYLCDSNYFTENIGKHFMFEDDDTNNIFIQTKQQIEIENNTNISLKTDELDETLTPAYIEIKDISQCETNLENIELDISCTQLDGEITLNKNLYNTTYNEHEHSEEETSGSEDEEELNGSEDEEELSGSEDEEELNGSEDEEELSGSEDEEELNGSEDEEELSGSENSDSGSEEETSGSENSDSGSEEETSGSDEDSDSDDEENINILFNRFPTQVVVIEKCENTLDNLLDKEDIKIEELESIIFQIITILYVYQKKYNFTHNDLHTNNIMYVNTDYEYINYNIKGKLYRIPTYGKIYKIIDFGRAIYEYNGELLCSDSFSSNGTAYTQYNFEPYYNDKKPVLEPNNSFDLCRLACSIFDFICDDIKNINTYRQCTPIYDLIFSWLYDDNGKNILYKSNGDDKYPGFKLYKMISRIVHKHIPENQYEHKVFEKFVIENVKEEEYFINIEKLLL